ncbi:MAG TPA: hypothetical protein VJM33_15640 [Microthrixaceae bacterium]|nr:hypothetical protein [Microthrixaceae bacterium]
MDGALIIKVGDDERALAPGQTLAFGRSGASADLDLGDDPRLHRRAGLIDVVDDGWTLRNTGRWLHLEVRDLEGPGSDRIEPGAERRIPWQRTRVEVPLGDCVFGFTAIDTSPRHCPDAAPQPARGDRTMPAFRIDRTSGYFRVLVGLCHMHLEHRGSADAPSYGEIARVVNLTGTERRPVTAKAVERRLAYCAQLFGLREANDGLPRAQVRNFRTALAELALSTGTITDRDLETMRG